MEGKWQIDDITFFIEQLNRRVYSLSQTADMQNERIRALEDQVKDPQPRPPKGPCQHIDKCKLTDRWFWCPECGSLHDRGKDEFNHWEQPTNLRAN